MKDHKAQPVKIYPQQGHARPISMVYRALNLHRPGRVLRFGPGT